MKHLLTIFFILNLFQLSSQTNEIETSALEKYQALSIDAARKNFKQSRLFVDTLKEIAIETNNTLFRTHAEYQYGVLDRMEGKYQEARQKFEHCKDQYEEGLDLAKVYYQLGAIGVHLSQFDDAILDLIEARKLASKHGDQVLEFKILNAIAVVFKNTYQLEKAQRYLFESEYLALITGDTASLTVIYNGIGVNFQKMEKLDSASIYFQRGLEIAQKYNHVAAIGQHSRNLAMIFQKNGELKKAAELHLTALEARKKQGGKLYIGGSFHDLGVLAFERGTYSKSLEYLNEALDIFQEIGDPSAINITQYEISKAYKAQGNMDLAFENLQKYTVGKDTIKDNEMRTSVNEINEKYESSIKEAEIQSQEAEINQKTYQRNLLFGGLGLSILLGSSFIWGLFSRNNRNKKIALQEKDLQNQKIQNLEKEKKLLSMSSLLEGQETERIRIAKDLHDGLGGLLTNVKAHFGKIQSEIENLENLDIYTSATQMIDKAHDEVRRISHNLMPADLRVGGLPIAVRQLIHEMKTLHEVETDFELIGFGDERMEEKVELSAYRIVQELSNNILKYAQAKSVFIQLSKFENELQIVVEDDGVGFDYEFALEAGDGLGLKSIQSRVDQLGGNLDVVSAKGKGSSFTINLPL